MNAFNRFSTLTPYVTYEEGTQIITHPQRWATIHPHFYLAGEFINLLNSRLVKTTEHLTVGEVNISILRSWFGGFRNSPPDFINCPDDIHFCENVLHYGSLRIYFEHSPIIAKFLIYYDPEDDIKIPDLRPPLENRSRDIPTDPDELRQAVIAQLWEDFETKHSSMTYDDLIKGLNNIKPLNIWVTIKMWNSAHTFAQKKAVVLLFLEQRGCYWNNPQIAIVSAALDIIAYVGGKLNDCAVNQTIADTIQDFEKEIAAGRKPRPLDDEDEDPNVLNVRAFVEGDESIDSPVKDMLAACGVDVSKPENLGFWARIGALASTLLIILGGGMYTYTLSSFKSAHTFFKNFFQDFTFITKTLTSISSVFKWVVAYAYYMVGIKEQSPADVKMQAIKTRFNKLQEDARLLATTLQANPAQLHQDTMAFKKLEEELEHLYKEVDTLSKTDKAITNYFMTISNVREYIKEIRDKYITLLQSIIPRFEPVCAFFAGTSSIGKSEIVGTYVPADLSTALKISCSKFAIPQEDKFYSGYAQQSFAIWEDFGRSVDDQDHLKLHQLKTTAKTTVNMAALNDKGMYFESPFLLAATNHKYYPKSNTCTDLNSLNRRRDFLFEVYLPTADEYYKETKRFPNSDAELADGTKVFPERSGRIYKYILRNPCPSLEHVAEALNRCKERKTQIYNTKVDAHPSTCVLWDGLKVNNQYPFDVWYTYEDVLSMLTEKYHTFKLDFEKRLSDVVITADVDLVGLQRKLNALGTIDLRDPTREAPPVPEIEILTESLPSTSSFYSTEDEMSMMSLDVTTPQTSYFLANDTGFELPIYFFAGPPGLGKSYTMKKVADALIKDYSIYHHEDTSALPNLKRIQSEIVFIDDLSKGDLAEQFCEWVLVASSAPSNGSCKVRAIMVGCNLEVLRPFYEEYNIEKRHAISRRVVSIYFEFRRKPYSLSSYDATSFRDMVDSGESVNTCVTTYVGRTPCLLKRPNQTIASSQLPTYFLTQSIPKIQPSYFIDLPMLAPCGLTTYTFNGSIQEMFSLGHTVGSMPVTEAIKTFMTVFKPRPNLSCLTLAKRMAGTAAASNFDTMTPLQKLVHCNNSKIEISHSEQMRVICSDVDFSFTRNTEGKLTVFLTTTDPMYLEAGNAIQKAKDRHAIRHPASAAQDLFFAANAPLYEKQEGFKGVFYNGSLTATKNFAPDEKISKIEEFWKLSFQEKVLATGYDILSPNSDLFVFLKFGLQAFVGLRAVGSIGTLLNGRERPTTIMGVLKNSIDDLGDICNQGTVGVPYTSDRARPTVRGTTTPQSGDGKNPGSRRRTGRNKSRSRIPDSDADFVNWRTQRTMWIPSDTTPYPEPLRIPLMTLSKELDPQHAIQVIPYQHIASPYFPKQFEYANGKYSCIEEAIWDVARSKAEFKKLMTEWYGDYLEEVKDSLPSPNANVSFSAFDAEVSKIAREVYTAKQKEFRSRLTPQASDDQAMSVLDMCITQTVGIRTVGGNQLCHALMLSELTGVTVAHIISDKYQYEITRDNLVVPIKIVKKDVTRDLAIFSVAKPLSNCRNLIKHIPPAAEFPDLCDREGLFTTKLSTNNRLFHLLQSTTFLDKRVNKFTDGVDKDVVSWYSEVRGGHLKVYATVSRAGDCGQACVAVGSDMPYKLIGIHNGGNSTYCSAAYLTREFVLEPFKLQNRSNLYQNYDYTEIRTFNSGLEDMNTFEHIKAIGVTKTSPFRPTKTKIARSPLHALPISEEPDMIPSILDENDPRLKEGDRMYIKRFKMFDHESPEMDEPLLDNIANQISDNIIQTMQKHHLKLRVLTKEQAINKMPELPGSSSIYQSSSAGWPWANKAKLKGKTDYIDFDTNAKPGQCFSFKDNDQTKDLHFAIDRIISNAKSRIPQVCVYTTGLKDEVVASKRVHDLEKQKTRLFFGCPLELAIANRMYCHAFSAAIASCPVSFPQCISLDINGLDYHHRKQRLLAKSDVGFDADFSNWDSTVPVAVSNRLHMIYNKVYRALDANWCPDDDIIREELLKYNIQPLVLFYNMVVRLPIGQPSGEPNTTLTNSLDNEILHRYVFFKANAKIRKPLPIVASSYDDNVVADFTGDDNECAVAAKILAWFNGLTTQSLFADIGMVMTSADKTGKQVSWRYVLEMEYTGCTTSIIGGNYVSILRESALMKALEWTDSKKAHSSWEKTTIMADFNPESITSTAENLLLACCTRGCDYYNAMVVHIVIRCAQYHIRKPPITCFEQMLVRRGVYQTHPEYEFGVLLKKNTPRWFQQAHPSLTDNDLSRILNSRCINNQAVCIASLELNPLSYPPRKYLIPQRSICKLLSMSNSPQTLPPGYPQDFLSRSTQQLDPEPALLERLSLQPRSVLSIQQLDQEKSSVDNMSSLPAIQGERKFLRSLTIPITPTLLYNCYQKCTLVGLDQFNCNSSLLEPIFKQASSSWPESRLKLIQIPSQLFKRLLCTSIVSTTFEQQWSTTSSSLTSDELTTIVSQSASMLITQTPMEEATSVSYICLSVQLQEVLNQLHSLSTLNQDPTWNSLSSFQELLTTTLQAPPLWVPCLTSLEQAEDLLFHLARELSAAWLPNQTLLRPLRDISMGPVTPMALLPTLALKKLNSSSMVRSYRSKPLILTLLTDQNCVQFSQHRPNTFFLRRALWILRHSTNLVLFPRQMGVSATIQPSLPLGSLIFHLSTLTSISATLPVQERGRFLREKMYTLALQKCTPRMTICLQTTREQLFLQQLTSLLSFSNIFKTEWVRMAVSKRLSLPTFSEIIPATHCCNQMKLLCSNSTTKSSGYPLPCSNCIPKGSLQRFPLVLKQNSTSLLDDTQLIISTLYLDIHQLMGSSRLPCIEDYQDQWGDINPLLFRDQSLGGSELQRSHPQESSKEHQKWNSSEKDLKQPPPESPPMSGPSQEQLETLLQAQGKQSLTQPRPGEKLFKTAPAGQLRERLCRMRALHEEEGLLPKRKAKQPRPLLKWSRPIPGDQPRPLKVECNSASSQTKENLPQHNYLRTLLYVLRALMLLALGLWLVGSLPLAGAKQPCNIVPQSAVKTNKLPWQKWDTTIKTRCMSARRKLSMPSGFQQLACGIRGSPPLWIPTLPAINIPHQPNQEIIPALKISPTFPKLHLGLNRITSVNPSKFTYSKTLDMSVFANTKANLFAQVYQFIYKTSPKPVEEYVNAQFYATYKIGKRENICLWVRGPNKAAARTGAAEVHLDYLSTMGYIKIKFNPKEFMCYSALIFGNAKEYFDRESEGLEKRYRTTYVFEGEGPPSTTNLPTYNRSRPELTPETCTGENAQCMFQNQTGK